MIHLLSLGTSFLFDLAPTFSSITQQTSLSIRTTRSFLFRVCVSTVRVKSSNPTKRFFVEVLWRFFFHSANLSYAQWEILPSSCDASQTYRLHFIWQTKKISLKIRHPRWFFPFSKFILCRQPTFWITKNLHQAGNEDGNWKAKLINPKPFIPRPTFRVTKERSCYSLDPEINTALFFH